MRPWYYLFRNRAIPFALTALACLPLACGRPPATQPAKAPESVAWFQEAAESVGLKFRHEAGPTGNYFFPQVLGSGAAFFDFDQDGRLDILLLQNSGPKSSATHCLFQQQPDGRFEDVTAGSGLGLSGYGMGAAIGDLNNDGLPDVLITEYGRLRIFENLGRGKFRDISQASGIDNPHWGTSASFLDYDRDGWLDLVVVNYVDYASARPCADAAGRPDFCGPTSFVGMPAKLYHNLGRQTGSSGIRFADVTYRSGLGALPAPGLGVVCADFDGDHWPDIFITNDAKPNHLWINQRDGTFKNEGTLRGTAVNLMGQAEANMGIALGDVNRDGLIDIFVTHLTDETNTLWRQERRGWFRDATGLSGLASPAWHGTGFGTVLADFDHDGALDLALVNGRVRRMHLLGTDARADHALETFWKPYAERNQLFQNVGQGRFQDVSPGESEFCSLARIGRGLAWGDIDNDGDVDLLVTNLAGPAALYRNVATKLGNWLMVKAVDPVLKRDAYGAEIHVKAGHDRWIGLVSPGSSYLCSHDPRVHFGLGQAESVEAITVYWPDGSAEVFPGCKANQHMTIRRGSGTPGRPGDCKP